MSEDAARRPIGLAHLSLIACDPPRLVEIAARSGFDFVGLRVLPVAAHEAPYDLSPGSTLLGETLTKLDDTGLHVRDIEFLLLDGSDQRDAWLRAFDAGSALGATSFTVASAIPGDGARDALERMAADGRAYGITPGIEPISYQGVRSLASAGALARETGCGIVVDALHLARFGGTLAEVAEVSDLLPLVQLCDGPRERPTSRDDLVAESRSARLAPGDGGLDPARILTVVPRDLPVSAEVPNDDAVARLGAQGWADRLFSATSAAVAHTAPSPSEHAA